MRVEAGSGNLAEPGWTAAVVRHEGKILAGIMLVGLVLRLYGITSPLVDSHHQRQAQTAMVTRNLFEDGMNVFATRYDIFGNTPGRAVLEFPFYNWIVALLYHLFGVSEILGRLTAVAFSLGAMVFMHRIGRRFLEPVAALIATGVYVLSPLNIYFSRAFMPESAMLFLQLGAVHYFLQWLESSRPPYYAAAVVFATLAYLVKWPSLLLLVPIAAAWLVQRQLWHKTSVAFLGYLMASVLPVLLWMAYANQVNAGLAQPWEPLTILIERVGGLSIGSLPVLVVGMAKSVGGTLLTPIGSVLATIGIYLAWRHPARVVLYGWTGVVLASIVALPQMNLWHPYYQLPLLPPAALFCGYGSQWVLSLEPSLWHTPRRVIAAMVIFLLTLAQGTLYVLFFWYMYDLRLRVPYHLQAAAVVRERTPERAVLILNDPPNALNTTLTYYAHRKSWPFPVRDGFDAIKDLESLRAKGGTVYVAIDSKYASGVADTRRNAVFWKYLQERFVPITVQDHFVVFDLSRSLP